MVKVRVSLLVYGWYQVMLQLSFFAESGEGACSLAARSIRRVSFGYAHVGDRFQAIPWLPR